jgi:hypothetical protein
MLPLLSEGRAGGQVASASPGLAPARSRPPATLIEFAATKPPSIIAREPGFPRARAVALALQHLSYSPLRSMAIGIF